MLPTSSKVRPLLQIPQEKHKKLPLPSRIPGPQYHPKALPPFISGKECPLQMQQLHGVWGKFLFFLLFTESEKLLAKIAQCPIPRFLMFSWSQERTPSVSEVPSALSHRLRPSPHCRFNVQNWSAEQRPRHHYPAGPKTPFLTGRKGFCESRV